MPNDSNYEYYVVDSSQSRYATALRKAHTTSHTLSFYTGYYAGGLPVVLLPQPFDVAQDLSTGNIWQYTGKSWVAPSWNSAITFYLGAATTVCDRIKSPDTKISENIELYIGTDPEVPAELALSENDLVIKHNLANYSVQVGVFRQDSTTDTVVEVPFPEGYTISTEDGNWTILKNFNDYTGFDFCTIALTWTTNINGAGQYLDFVTSGEAREIAEEVLSSGAIIENQPFSTTVGGYTMIYSSNGLEISNPDAAIGVRINGRGVYLDVIGGSAYIDDISMRFKTIDGGEIAVTESGITANGSAITQASSEFAGTSLGIEELSGGVKYVCESALTALSIGGVAAGCNAAFFFTVASGAVVTLPGSLGSRFYGEYPNSVDTSYCLAITDDMAVCAPAVSAGV